MTDAVPPELVVPSRFRGPPSSGNGGWTAGAVAAHLVAREGTPDAAVQVTLRRPPPLDTVLQLGPDDTGALVLGEGGAAVLTARLAEVDPPVLEAVGPAVAAAAQERYAGLRSHPFPGCFVCGTDREAGDGLRIFPGRVDDDDQGRTRVAATWTPVDADAEDWHEYAGAPRRASYAVTWAALDCAGAWAGDLEERLMVLGTMTARVHELPEVGVEHVVVGADRGTEGRKTFTATTIHAPDGRVVGASEQVWIAVDRAAFG